MLNLHFKSYGQGYPVIILHGLFGTLDNWHSFAKKLSKDYTVYSIDQRDHGRSPKTDAFSYELLAEDLFHFMEDNWIHEAYIIGHSMGGKTLMEFALEHPGKIKKGVVIDIAPRQYHHRHIEIMKSMSLIDLNNVTSRDEIKNHLKVFIHDDRVVQFLMKNFSFNIIFNT